MAVKAKELRFAVEIDGNGRTSAESGTAVDVPEDWEAEHLVLAGLVRCTLKSFRYAASRRGVAGGGSGRARGTVTRRADGSYAFVEITVELEVEVDAIPADGVNGLVAHAQRGCFVGNSFSTKPRYRWTVNGAPVASAA